MGAFKIRRYNSQSDNQDPYIIDPHSAESENLSSLSGHALVEHWPWAEVLILGPTSRDALYADAALRAKMARFDAIELHAAHGYLISQFLSPHINKRTDRYGKDLEGRCRFLVEIVQRIKEKVGNDYPISVRFSADEIIPEGYHLDEAKYVARRMEEIGVAILHVSSGLFESREWSIQPMVFEPACLVV